MKNIKKINLLIISIILALVLTACGGEEKADENTIKVGLTSDESEVWDYIKEELKKEDINIEIVSFGDYTRPNLALAEGEVDINSFQHYAFFEKFKEEHNLDLEPVGETVIAPLGIYSNKIEDISEIKEGDTIALASDETNLGRGLILLEKAGLIKVKDTPIPTLDDVVENKLNLELKDLDASIIARTLDDVDAGLINSGYAVDAGFSPEDDSIYLEEIDDSSKPYVNIIVARSEDKDSEIIKRIVEVYQTDEVEEIINKIYGGGQQVAW